MYCFCGYQYGYLSQFFNNEPTSYYIVCLVLSVLITIAFHIIYYYKSLQDQKLISHQIKEGKANAQLSALKNQLDPHFLFNSLNVLTSLIEESPEKAQQFTTTLSRVYRYVLENKNEDAIPLGDELTFAHAYMKLLKMRFEEGLLYDIPTIPSDQSLKIAPLSLQLLLENAIKHNTVSKDSPLKIKVYESDGYLFVTNNKQLKESLHSSGIGLQSIVERYSTLTDKAVSISQNAASFSVQLPTLTQIKNNQMKTTDQLLDEKRYARAKSKLKKIVSFYYHAFFYVLVMIVLGWINYQTTDFPWIIFPLLGWGFGLTNHALEAYDKSLFFGKAWEQRKIEKIMSKEEKFDSQFKSNK